MHSPRRHLLPTLLCLSLLGSPALASDAELSRLIATFMEDTPMVSDLHSLTDEIGGRAAID